MITKEYKCSTVISFPINLKNGEHKRIKFSPYSWGGSIYQTSDTDEIYGIENTSEFKSGCVKIISVTDDDAVPVSVEEPEIIEEKEPTKVEVSDLDEAKDYLVDNFGYKRSKLRSSVAIKEAASAHDIEFIGI